MDLEGAFFDLEGALLHSLPKSGGTMAILPPSSYVPAMERIQSIIVLLNKRICNFTSQ